jgi:hypothetical protein
MMSLGLKEQQQSLRVSCCSRLELPKELLSVEEALKMLAGALKMACKPGRDKVKVFWNRAVPSALCSQSSSYDYLIYIKTQGHKRKKEWWLKFFAETRFFSCLRQI